jgi:heme/copper-type cytochrome/quinol oxidase subunit 2
VVQLAQLGWVLVAVATVAFVGVMAMLLDPLVRHRRDTWGSAEHTGLLVLASAVPGLLLLAMYVLSLPAAAHPDAERTVHANVQVVDFRP